MPARKADSAAAGSSLGEMFVCERLHGNAKLSAAGCARRWSTAQESRPQPEDGLYPCLTCPIGAARAGRPGDGAFEAAELLRKWAICPRCCHPGSRIPSGRLVKGHLCISCYKPAPRGAERQERQGQSAQSPPPRCFARRRRRQHHQTDALRGRPVGTGSDGGRGDASEGPARLPVRPGPATRRRLACRPCATCRTQISERAGVYCCGVCGGEGRGSPEAVCGCGIRFPGTPLRASRLFRCRLRAVDDPATPGTVVIAFGEESVSA